MTLIIIFAVFYSFKQVIHTFRRVKARSVRGQRVDRWTRVEGMKKTRDAAQAASAASRSSGRTRTPRNASAPSSSPRLVIKLNGIYPIKMRVTGVATGVYNKEMPTN